MLAASFILFSLVIVQTGSPQEGPRASEQSAAPVSQGTAAPRGKSEGSAKYLATIIRSGSTNTRPYKVFIHANGSATVQLLGGSSSVLNPQSTPLREKHLPSGTIDAKTLRKLLGDVADVSKILTGSCPKSVSFGTRIQISYAGKTSGDLQCILVDTSHGADNSKVEPGQALGKFVENTLRDLKINASRFGTEP